MGAAFLAVELSWWASGSEVMEEKLQRMVRKGFEISRGEWKVGMSLGM